MRRSLVVLVTIVLGVLLGVPATAGASTPYCGITWGSLPKEAGVGSTDEMYSIRTGRHDCFDRMVLDVIGDVRGYSVRYVDEIRKDGSGELVPVRGGARLQVVAMVPTIATDAIFLPNGELADVSTYDTFRHVAWAGQFEGQTTIGLGVRARLPFRVMLLDGPGTWSRMVVDVAHLW